MLILRLAISLPHLPYIQTFLQSFFYSILGDQILSLLFDLVIKPFFVLILQLGLIFTKSIQFHQVLDDLGELRVCWGGVVVGVFTARMKWGFWYRQWWNGFMCLIWDLGVWLPRKPGNMKWSLIFSIRERFCSPL